MKQQIDAIGNKTRMNAGMEALCSNEASTDPMLISATMTKI